MKKPKAIIIRTAGTNCDIETQVAFNMAGAVAEKVHVNQLINGSVNISDYQLMAFPGGFSYGDDIASGKILANELKYKLGDLIKEFAFSGKPIIGICNGFQVLVKMGLLPGSGKLEQTATLTFNDSDKFECRWIFLKTENGLETGKKGVKSGNRTKCLWSENMPEIVSLPVAHGEGKFVPGSGDVLKNLEKNGQIVFRYVGPKGEKGKYPFNPNGAVSAIAGICNLKGNVFGLMPHPERFVYSWQHPNRESVSAESVYGWGLEIFKNAVNFVK